MTQSLTRKLGFKSTKTYTHSVGLSCAFRQWRAHHSHCRHIHGYALEVRFEFGASELDDKNWVVDFGGLKDVRDFLVREFDHKLIIAADDPQLDLFRKLRLADAADIIILQDVGCERFAEYIFNCVSKICEVRFGSRVHLNAVEVREHGGNSAIYGVI